MRIVLLLRLVFPGVYLILVGLFRVVKGKTLFCFSPSDVEIGTLRSDLGVRSGKMDGNQRQERVNGEDDHSENIDELLKKLDLIDEESEEIVLEESVDDLKVKSKWSTLAKVHSPKPLSHAAFICNMRYAWSLARDVKFKVIGYNMFLLQFFCQGEWVKVFEGPWLFRGNAVPIEEYDGITRPSNVRFDNLVVWICICGSPLAFRKESVGRLLVGRLVEVL